MNITVVSSPQAQVGKTTIANFYGARAKTSTLLLEMGHLGYSPYIHGSVNASETRSISKVMINPSSLKDNIFQTDYKYFRFSSMNVVEDIMKLNLPNGPVAEIVEEASRAFNEVILDTSSDMHSGVNKVIFSKEFRDSYPVNDIIVVDENIATFKALSDFNTILKIRELTIKPVIIINKARIYEDYMKSYLTKLSNINPILILTLEEIPELRYYLNNGEINVKDKKVAEFRRTIDELADRLSRNVLKKEFTLEDYLVQI